MTGAQTWTDTDVLRLLRAQEQHDDLIVNGERELAADFFYALDNWRHPAGSDDDQSRRCLLDAVHAIAAYYIARDIEENDPRYDRSYDPRFDEPEA